MRPMTTALALGLALASLALPALADDEDRRITVTGTAEVETPPDRASITTGVVTREATATGALEANSKAMAAVFASLGKAGIEKRDTQTSELALSPVYSEPENAGAEGPKIVGYEATNMVTVRVRDIPRLGEVIDALAASGANRFYNIGFSVADPDAVLEGARREAVADGRAKAELFAEAAGVTLGPLLTLSEGGGGIPPVTYGAKIAMDAAPVAEGTVSLSARVEMVYAIR